MIRPAPLILTEIAERMQASGSGLVDTMARRAIRAAKDLRDIARMEESEIRPPMRYVAAREQIRGSTLNTKGYPLKRFSDWPQAWTSDDGAMYVIKRLEPRGRLGLLGVGPQAINEEAAFRFASLYCDLVPPTAVIRGPDGNWYSAQLFVVNSPVENWRRADSNDEPFSQQHMEWAAFLDEAIRNIDRHFGNFGRDPQGNLVLFDHGLAFPKNPDIPANSVFSDIMLGRRFLDVTLEGIHKVSDDEVYRALDMGLPEPQIERTIDLINRIKNDEGIRST